MANFIPRTWYECTEPEITNMYEDVHQQARRLGYYIDKPKLYVYKSTRRFGECRTRGDVSVIALNEKFLECPEKCMETLVHEYAHAINPKDHHGVEWKSIGDDIGKHYGVSMSRTTPESEVGIKISKPKDIKYIVKCPKCGAQWRYERASKIVQHPEKYRCGHCKCELIRER